MGDLNRASSLECANARAAFERMQQSPDAPSLATAGSRSVEAWFLGPKAENAGVLEQLVVEAVRDHAFWRRNYFPGDPTHIPESLKRDPDYVAAMEALQDGFRGLLANLKKSVPFFSMRYQGHMNWDLTLPGIAGYFAAMLYNPNNVAFEGSTATTLLELLVGDDLCRMLGYQIPLQPDKASPSVRPWGHVTCDGTVANIEAIWAARNLKFYPLALRHALRVDPLLAAAQEFAVKLPTGGEQKLIGLDSWQLLNLSADVVLSLPGKIAARYSLSKELVTRSVGAFSLQTLGWPEFCQTFLADVIARGSYPVVTVPGSKHYSFPKAAALLGLGVSNLIDIPVDRDARQDVTQLRRRLEDFLHQRRPVIAVVAVIGTTEESAVDPLADILQLRDDFAKRGLTFHVHADAAWGGYHRSILNDNFELLQPTATAEAELTAPPPIVGLSDHVTRQFVALPGADSITVDPHKSGYIPYPAGALCYRNAAMRDLVTFSAPVVFHGEAEPTVGVYGIEGSKPGAAAAAIYLSHRVIRPAKSGYGKIIGQALYSCRRLYARLLSMDEPQRGYKAIPLPRLPAERGGGNVVDQREQVATLIDRRTGEQIRANAAAAALLQEIGPDQNILAYAFNAYLPNGALNADLDVANRLNKAIYKQLSIQPGDDIYGYRMIVSTTDLYEAAYGPLFMRDYKRRLGVDETAAGPVTVIRSVVMDPWVTETSQGSFIDVLEQELRAAVTAALSELRPLRTVGY